MGFSAVIASRLKDHIGCATILINLCGMSSTGKTTAEMLMCSPFMAPTTSHSRDTLFFSANATANALWASFDGIHGVPFVVDDIVTNHMIDRAAFIYTLSEGAPKARCYSNGHVRQSSFGWSGVAITSSEGPILGEINNQDEGLKVRVIQTEGIQWTKDAAESDTIKQTLVNNYGFYGGEFGRFIQGMDFNELCNRHSEAKDYVESLMEHKDQFTSRLANKYAVIYLTAQLLKEAFGFNIDAEAIIAKLIACEQTSIAERDNSIKALEVVKEFITMNQNNFRIMYCLLDPSRPDSKGSYGKRFGEIRVFEGKCFVHLIASKTEEILRNNGINDIKRIRSRWRNAGIVECGERDRNTTRKTIDGKRVYCDCFVFEEDFLRAPFPESMSPKKPDYSKVFANNTQPPVVEVIYDDEDAINAIFEEKPNESKPNATTQN